MGTNLIGSCPSFELPFDFLIKIYHMASENLANMSHGLLLWCFYGAVLSFLQLERPLFVCMEKSNRNIPQNIFICGSRHLESHKFKLT